MLDEYAVVDEHPTKGWNRASIIWRSRKEHRPNVRAEDLLTPRGRGNLRMLGMCAAMAAMMTALYVWTSFFFLVVFLPVGPVVYWSVLGGAALALTAVLYAFGTRETRRDRRLAADL